MSELTERQDALLLRVVQAMPAGYQFREGETADVITLGVRDLVVFTKTHPQRAVATDKGKAHVRRTAA